MTTPIQVLRTVAAPSSQVFDAWVSSDTVVAPVRHVTMDVILGGAIVVSTGGDSASDLTGRFLAVEPPHRLRYTWRWGTSAEESVVDVQFHDLGSTTVVEVNHGGFLDDLSRQSHQDGWVRYLDSLSRFT